MVHNMKVNLKMEQNMDMDSISGQTIPITKGFGRITTFMVKENTNGPMDESTLVNGSRMK